MRNGKMGQIFNYYIDDEMLEWFFKKIHTSTNHTESLYDALARFMQ